MKRMKIILAVLLVLGIAFLILKERRDPANAKNSV